MAKAKSETRRQSYQGQARVETEGRWQDQISKAAGQGETAAKPAACPMRRLRAKAKSGREAGDGQKLSAPKAAAPKWQPRTKLAAKPAAEESIRAAAKLAARRSLVTAAASCLRLPPMSHLGQPLA